MKKGQAAMDFLMTYGWAIVVVLAAIGALWYFGVLSPNKQPFYPCDCQAECHTTLGNGYNQISCCEKSTWKNGTCVNTNQITRIYMNGTIFTGYGAE